MQGTTIINKSSSSGIGFVGLLTILFIALKLTTVITWSWWWVLSPLWIGFATFLAIAAIAAIAIFIFAIVAVWANKPSKF